MPQPLPENVPPHLGHSEKIEGIRKAYSTLLKIQEAIGTRESRESHEQKLIHVRILGYLIREGPSLTASEFVAEEVNSYEEDEDQIDKAGERYYLHYLRPFKRYRGRTPESSHSSCHTFETRKEMMMEMLRQADKPPRNHSAAKKKALVRDDYQCIVSGRYDPKFVMKNDELKAEVLSSRLPIGVTQCAHIMPDSINRNISDSKDKHEHAASMWAILSCFGYEDLPDRLKGSEIHGLDNVMTLDLFHHHWFDRLDLWFEAVEGSPNTYTIKATDTVYLVSCKADDRRITLTSAFADLPLPNPVYFEIHAACCRVAHLSGAGEYMNKVLEDMEDTSVLSEDGSSAHILSFVLQQEAIHQWTTV
ncbi:hypothetical protein H4582DRAFT_277290 [Lactarius indigo]|nr:hypothetical protein H4582DRAFT_277290 [Lactarius indigo]